MTPLPDPAAAAVMLRANREAYLRNKNTSKGAAIGAVTPDAQTAERADDGESGLCASMSETACFSVTECASP